MISLTAATGLLEAIEATGRDPDELLHALGLTRTAFSDRTGSSPTADFARVLEEAARATGDDASACTSASATTPRTSAR